MAGISSMAVPVLEANNFNNWQFRILTILRREQCIDAIEKTLEPTATTQEKEAWNKLDTKAQSVIVQGVSDKHLDIIKDCKSARGQIDALKKVFVRSSSITKLSLWRKLINLKTTNKRLEDHFLKFDTIIRELKEHGTELSDSDKVCHLLLSLTSKYDTVVTALETVTNVTLEFVKARLLDEEVKAQAKTDSNDSETEASFKAAGKGCFKCGNLNHFQAQCPRNQNSRGRPYYRSRGLNKRGGYRNKNWGQDKQHQANEAEEEVQMYAANLCTNVEGKITFVLDSGASNHFVTSAMEKYMINIRNLESPVSIHIANGEMLRTDKIGILKLECQGHKLSVEALIVPKIKHNLLSASKLTSRGHKIVVEKDKLEIRGKNFLLRCQHKNGLYVLTAEYLSRNRSIGKSKEFGNIAVDDLWHRRLGHAGKDSLIQLGLPTENKICSTCVEGKSTRNPFKTKEKVTKHMGELIHSDVCGPINPVAVDGTKYFQTIIDDYSHFVVVKTLKAKDEADENLIEYTRQLERQHDIKVKAFRLDNGGEFISHKFKNFCKQKGIILEFTMPYTPQENGVAERMNRTLLDKIRTKIIDSAIPKNLWNEALKCSAYEINRLPTKSLPKGVTPSKIWNGRNDLSKLRIFGCRSWYTVLPKCNKLLQRARKAIFVGYCGGGYRLWLKDEEKIVKSRDVKFDESVMEFKAQDTEKVSEKSMESKPIHVPMYYPSEESDKTETEDTNEEERPEQVESETSSSSEESTDEYEENYVPLEETVTRSGRKVVLPKPLDDYEIYTAYCLLTKTYEEPNSYKEASQMPEWQQAISKELSSHEKLETWQPAELPSGQTAIDTRWIFKIKEDGTKKARLVAKGFQVPYHEGEEFSYAPVCRLSTIRILISTSVQNDWKLHQIDVPTAFLNGTLDNDVYIKTPEGLNTTSKYLKLNRALYGLRNAPKCWNVKFNEVMTKLNFKRSDYDYCLYFKDNVYLVLFVDDALITGPDDKVSELLNKLYEQFKIKNITEVKVFLGMEINKSDKGLKITQTKMTLRLLEEFCMQETRTVSTPMEVNFQVSEDEPIIENVPYRRLICSLMYLSLVSRPDIAFSVAYLSRYLDKPTKSTWEAGKRILRYLNTTKNYGLLFKKGKAEVFGLADADWGGDKQTRKSVSGFVCFHGENPIAWHSRKQNCVAQSSMEAEYISAGLAAQELVNIKGILSDFKVCKPIVLKIDNMSAISLVKNFENSKRGKHIEIKYHFIKDLCLRKEIILKYICSGENISDMFTKPLGKEKFVKFRSSIVQ